VGRVALRSDLCHSGKRKASPCGAAGSVLFFLLLFAAVSVPTLPAEELPATLADSSPYGGVPPQPFIGDVSFYFDNDFITGSDNKYTAGLGFVWTSAATETYSERNLHRKIANAFSFLPTVNAEGYRSYLQFRLGTEMYTPTDIQAPEPPPGDHPYAGVIYLDSSLLSMSRLGGHQFTLRLGLVGPATGAADVQEWVHERTGSPIPQGWDTQLKNEPIVNLFCRPKAAKRAALLAGPITD
jgi:hypothetical protein